MRRMDEKVISSLGEYIGEYQRQYGTAPSFRTIMDAMGMASLCTVQRYVLALRDRGIITIDEDGSISCGRRLCARDNVMIPLVGTVTCGAPILAQENIEGNYSLPSELFGNGELFMLHAVGDSMIDAGIYDGDLVVVRRTAAADYGDIVVALIEDSATVKRYHPNATTRRIHLHPENETMSDIIVDSVTILGRVVSVIHSF